MIELTKINLLPYRQAVKLKKQQQFKTLMLAALATGALLSAGVYFAIDEASERQAARNNFLQDEIGKLDKVLGEIKKLNAEKAGLLAKSQKVQELQENRLQAAYIIDTLNVLTPDRIYLTELAAVSPNTYTLTGRASDDNVTATFMRTLPSTGVFAQPELISIKKAENYQEFTLKFLLNQPQNAAQFQTALQEEK